jgi:hypothetical protein
MTFDLSQVSWLGVIVGAAIYFFLGALWYSRPLFANQWQAAIGWDASRPEPQTNPMTYVVPALLYLIAGVAMAILAGALGVETLTDGLVLGLITGLGFALPMVGVEATFDPNKPKPMAWFLITVAYHLIGFAILGVAVAVL